ncbi:MAG: multiheme c-type cytochrome [Planctomycetota bacterium]|jgi:hypothetical protein
MSTRLCILLGLLLAGCDRPEQTPSSQPAGHGWSQAPRPATVRPFAFDDPDAVILVTGGSHGRLETCNCAESVAGGLTRRGGMAASYRKAFGDVLLVDAGDFFWVEPGDLRNRYVIKGYRLIGYDALALGDHEWGAITEDLGDILRAHPLTYLATNVTARKDRLPLTPALVRELGRARIAVLSYLGPGTMGFLGGLIPDRLELAAPEAVARKAAELKKNGCVVILLAHAQEHELPALGAIQDVDLIVRGDTSRSEADVKRLGDTPIIKVGGGDFVGAVALKVDGARIARMDFRLETVSLHWPEDLRLMKVFQAYAHQVLRTEYDMARAGPFTQRDPAGCGACHPAQYRAWRAGPHGRSGRHVAAQGDKADPDCLFCHTGGYRTDGGFRSLKATPHLANVTCQQCHRFDPQEAIRTQGKCPPAPKITEQTCTLCHTPRISPNFKLATRRAEIGCVRVKAATRPASGPTAPGAAQADRSRGDTYSGDPTSPPR